VFLLNFFILISFSLKAEDSISSKSLDINQDNKVDRIENYKNGELISVARDTKFNGKFDETSYYYPYESPTKPTEVIEKDTDGDGKVDRIEKVYRDPDLDLMVRTIKVTTKRSPASEEEERSWVTYSKLSQLKEGSFGECSANFSLDSLAIMKLNDDVKSVRYLLDDGFYKTKWGYNIHQSCLDLWGANSFPQILKKAMDKGLQCLDRLAKENKKKDPTGPNGAYRNLKELEFLLVNKPITLTCNETNFKWKGTNVYAHASASPVESIASLNVKHPYVSLNPSLPINLKKPTKDEEAEMGATLFHEQFHNLGYTHENDIEYAYACETCCIKNERLSDEEKADACNICAGNYQNSKDKKYIVDLIKWGKSSYKTGAAISAAANFQKEFPNDRFGAFAYASANAGVLGPIGVELNKHLKKKFPNISGEEKKLLDLSSSDSIYDFSMVSPSAQILAKLHYEVYSEQKKPNDTLNEIEKELTTFKQMLKSRESATGSAKLIYDSVAKELEMQLTDIWMLNYPNSSSPENMRAYRLMRELNL
jgi:hypothetical protein